MAGGRDKHEFVPGTVSGPWLPGESGAERIARLKREAAQVEEAAHRRAFTRPQRPGFCWVSVELHGQEVGRPGLVARWDSKPDGWLAETAWTDLEGGVHVEWVVVERLTPVEVERAP